MDFKAALSVLHTEKKKRALCIAMEILSALEINLGRLMYYMHFASQLISWQYYWKHFGHVK